MTNAEKFKEVFGFAIDDKFPDDPCTIIDSAICVNHVGECETCEMHNFWDVLEKIFMILIWIGMFISLIAGIIRHNVYDLLFSVYCIFMILLNKKGDKK